MAEDIVLKKFDEEIKAAKKIERKIESIYLVIVGTQDIEEYSRKLMRKIRKEKIDEKVMEFIEENRRI